MNFALGKFEMDILQSNNPGEGLADIFHLKNHMFQEAAVAESPPVRTSEAHVTWSHDLFVSA